MRVVACQVEIYNPNARGANGLAAGAPQWIDVIAKHMSLGLLALDIESNAAYPAIAKRYAEEKAGALTLRGIPYLCQPAAGLWELEANIAVWIRQLEKGKIT
jgi:hypothetical protein